MTSWIRGHPASTLFLTAFLLRLGWVILTPGYLPINDAAWYLEAGKTMARTGAYLDGDSPTAFWPVGYPFFLSCFYRLGDVPLFAVRIFQGVLSSAVSVMIFSLTRASGQSRRAALIAGLAFALFPSAISLSTVLLSETLFTFLLFGAFFLANQNPSFARIPPSGLMLAAAIFVRPVAVLLAPLIYLPHLWEKRRKLYLLGTLGVFAVSCATTWPWAIRNYRVFGEFVPNSTNLGMALYIGHNPDADGFYLETEELGRILADSGSNEAATSRKLAGLAKEYALSHPAREFNLLARKFASLLIRERTPVYESFVTDPKRRDFNPLERLVAVGNNLYFLLLLAVFIGTAWWKFRALGGLRTTSFLACWVQILFYCAFFVAERYKFPSIPFLIVAVSPRLSDWTIRAESWFAKRKAA